MRRLPSRQHSFIPINRHALLFVVCLRNKVVRESTLSGIRVGAVAGFRQENKVGALELRGDDVRDLLQPRFPVLR